MKPLLILLIGMAVFPAVCLWIANAVDWMMDKLPLRREAKDIGDT